MKKCSRHSDKYQIHSSSVLCSHPECIKRICLEISNKSNSVKRLYDICLSHHSADDMVGYIVERLLIEHNEKQKPFVINPTFLFFTLNRFIRDEMIQIAVEDELQDDWESKLDSYSGWYKRSTPSAEGLYLGMDLVDIIADQFGQPYALYYMGGLSKTDLMKVENIGPRELLGKLRVIEEWIEENYIN